MGNTVRRMSPVGSCLLLVGLALGSPAEGSAQDPSSGRTTRSALLGGLVAVPLGAALGGGLCYIVELDDDGTVKECALIVGAMSFPVGGVAGFGVGRAHVRGWQALGTGAVWGGGFGLAVATVVNGITSAGDGAFVPSTLLGIGLGSALIGGLAGLLVG